MNKVKTIAISLCVLMIFSGCLDRKTKPSENITITRGLDFMVRNNYDKAIELFSNILLEDKNNSLALYYRGLSYYKKGDNDSGTIDFEELYNNDKDFNYESGYLWNVLLKNFNVQKDYTKTIKTATFYIKKYPDDENKKNAYNIIAGSYLRLKEFDKAIANYEKVIEVSKHGVSLTENRLIGDAQAAILFIKENSDYDRKPLYMFSDIQSEIDTFKKIEIAKKLLELYPKSTLADKVQYQIARLYSVDGLNDFDQATKEYQLFLEKYPDSPLVTKVKYSLLGITEKYDPEEGKLKGSVH